MAGIAVAAMVGLGVITVVDTTFTATARELPCERMPGTAHPFEGDRHLAYDGQDHPAYQTVPPTSGWHSPQVAAPGVYREPIPEELQVHFLEHGHVLIQYAPATPDRTVEVLETIARRNPRDVAVAPYPKLGKGVALTGWQRSQLLAELDQPAVEAFVAAVAGRYEHTWKRGATACV
ncbi:DUF3105 domain-containing protein [Nonomuraea sp. NBC_01738]|uniref:DUF3105 domain-containing protein n=1 Tax=Nonomuraea sp. NBC_01738 TaxID=2976003 RepID=UPI002E13C0A0|nr:DUF3105 domain-containing protein [Nonomuraea sp. NBC_01738]